MAALRYQLRGVLKECTIGCGTPAAVALMSALLVDLAQANRADGVRHSPAPTDTEIEALAAGLGRALKQGPVLILPLGAEIVCLLDGTICIEPKKFCCDAGKPGLHAEETTDRRARGPNLALRRDHIETLTRNLECGAVGLPSAWSIGEQGGSELLRFPKFGPAGDIVLMRPADILGVSPFCSLPATAIERLANSMLDDMRPGHLLHRYRERDELRALGADGSIGNVAAAIVSVAPGSPTRVLADLARCFATTISFPTNAAPPHAQLIWEDGTIRCQWERRERSRAAPTRSTFR